MGGILVIIKLLHINWVRVMVKCQVKNSGVWRVSSYKQKT
jgi:hypothetical protein